jgi:hypothetical protein
MFAPERFKTIRQRMVCEATNYDEEYDHKKTWQLFEAVCESKTRGSKLNKIYHYIICGYIQGQAALATAVRHGHLQLVQALLAMGADPTTPTLIRRADPACLEALLYAGARPKAEDIEAVRADMHMQRSVFNLQEDAGMAAYSLKMLLFKRRLAILGHSVIGGRAVYAHNANKCHDDDEFHASNYTGAGAGTSVGGRVYGTK